LFRHLWFLQEKNLCEVDTKPGS